MKSRNHSRSVALCFALIGTVWFSGCAQNSPGEEPVETTRLVQYASWEELEADLEGMLIREMETMAEQWTRRDNGTPGLSGEPTTTQTPSDKRVEGEDFSGTNNQEKGVDEGDFVKTDGFHMYAINGNRLHIFGIPQFGELQPVSEYKLEGYPRELLVHSAGNRLAVFSTIWVESLPLQHPLRDGIVADNLGNSLVGSRSLYFRAHQVTKITLLDIETRSRPQLVREIYIEGDALATRLVDSTVRIGTYSWMNIPYVDPWFGWQGGDADIETRKRTARAAIRALRAEDLLPASYERLPDGTFTKHSVVEHGFDSFYRPMNSDGRGITSVITFDLLDDSPVLDADHVITNYPKFYATADNLYIAESSHDWWWFWSRPSHPDQLNIHKFETPVANESHYVGSGRVHGTLLNSFSMDEHDGFLRVATTTDPWARWWVDEPSPPATHVWVLEHDTDKLVQVGHVGGIAEGEQLFAARFEGDRGFLVTFERVDPLFTLDLADPENPSVVGELEIPGFSTYIHAIEDDKLLTIGVGGDEDGVNWETQISMFDVADFANPGLVDTQLLSEDANWSWSEAMREHKAFQYWAPKQLLAVPVSTFRADPLQSGWQYLSVLELITVDTTSGLERKGSIDHSHLYNRDSNVYWYNVDIRRSFFMGDFIYAISDRGITAHDVDTLTLKSEVMLPGYTPSDLYWWW